MAEYQTVHAESVPGASDATQPVKVLNANWVPSATDGQDGQFQLLLVTDDAERHVLTPSPAAFAALVTLAASNTLLLWDPEGPALIAANIVGRMPWTDRVEQQRQAPASQ